MPILFADICLLFDRISAVKPAQKDVTPQTQHPLTIFKAWLSHLQGATHRQALLIFRLIFPDHDIRRRYGMQETILAAELPKALFLPSTQYGSLSAWESSTHDSRDACCLGAALEKLLTTRRCHSLQQSPSLSIEQLDALLDQLAAHCPFSSAHILSAHHHARPRRQILHDIFDPLSAREAAYAAQIILRDLSPLLYPTPSHDLEISLSNFNSNAFRELELGDALRAWSWALPTIRRVIADFDTAFLMLEKRDLQPESAYTASQRNALVQMLATPVVGSRIDIPKAHKARSCRDAIKLSMQAVQPPPSTASTKLYLETKYDGERMQIHVDMGNLARPVTIFSKSKRDSTMDREATHAIILCALGLASPELLAHPSMKHLAERYRTALTSASRGPPSQRVILEAEMVAYNEAEGSIDEFAYLSECDRSGPSAHSQPGHSKKRARSPQEALLDSSQMSSSDSRGRSRGRDAPMRHLAVVFFDCLLVDDNSLILDSYETRRAMLERLIMPIDGYAMLADRTSIDLAGLDVRAGQQMLAREFARCIVARQEGLMLKMGTSTYNDHRRGSQWIKLKKDYIPGLGDSVSCCIVGASWDKTRARQLRVPASCYTTFYVGLLENEQDRNLDPSLAPRYHVAFSVSYMASRAMLLQANNRIVATGAVAIDTWKTRVRRSWDFDLSFAPGMDKAMSIVFNKPLVFELFGAGFTRSNGRANYELRFPRVSAIHHTRTVEECITLQQMQHIARDATSCTESEAEAEIDDLWSRCSSSGASETEAESCHSSRDKALGWREREEEQWYKKLMKADRGRGNRWRDAATLSPKVDIEARQQAVTTPEPGRNAPSITEQAQGDKPEAVQSKLHAASPTCTIGLTIPAADVDYAWFASERTSSASTILPRCAKLHSLSTLLLQAGYVRRKSQSTPEASHKFKHGMIVTSTQQSMVLKKHFRKAWRRCATSQACIAFVDEFALAKVSSPILSVHSIPAACIIDVAI